jgi:tetratricopeptide (TPR) repeat protein
MSLTTLFDAAGIDPDELKKKVAQARQDRAEAVSNNEGQGAALEASDTTQEPKGKDGIETAESRKGTGDSCEKGLPPIDLASSAAIDAAAGQKRRLIAEINELERQRRWEDILALAYPMEEKYPLLTDMEMDIEISRKLGFALIRTNRHHEAVALFETLARKMPHDFMVVYSAGYAAYDALYCHKNRQLTLSPQEKKRLIRAAHHYFEQAARLRPDSVTLFYRRGMLYKEIEGKPKKAIPCFDRAIEHWNALSEAERESRHQERPKYIRSMYHLASCLLKESLASKALSLLEKTVAEDEATGFVSTLFKEFALGKTLYRLGRFKEALDHLEVAAAAAEHGKVPDFVRELAAGCLLMMDRPREALKEIDKIPLKAMRPYVCWRRADILVAMGRNSEALMTLESALERDRISKHKTLMRMARIHYGQGSYSKALAYAKKADLFYQQRFGNRLSDALFMEALCLHATGDHQQALERLQALRRDGFSAPGFSKALRLVQQAATEHVAGRSN